MTAGNLYLIDDSFDDNTATNGAAVYAVQGCGQVSLHYTIFSFLYDPWMTYNRMQEPENPAHVCLPVIVSLIMLSEQQC